jgi:hypothetical protein
VSIIVSAISMNANKLSSASEHRLIQDDDGHWYIIPVGHEQVFQRWVDAMTKGSRHLPANFEPVQVDGPHTVVFMGWREMT